MSAIKSARVTFFCLYATFGFLVEAFAQTSRKYGGDEPNISAIATHVENLAQAANNGERLSAQSQEAIKSRIEIALDAKKAKLPQK